MDLQIHSLNGQLLFQEKHKLTQGQNDFEVNISALTTGAYLYVLRFDDVEMKSSIFTVVK